MSPASDTPSPEAAWIELPDKRIHVLAGDCYMGRIEGNEIVIPDDKISRRHAVVQRQGLRFALVDLGSTNGTFLNQTRIFKPTVLDDGDVILVGAQRYVFHQPVVPDEEDALRSTAVIVSKTSCWMLLVAPPEPADAVAVAWADQVRETVVRGGAEAKHIRGAALFCYWRDGLTTADAVRLLVHEIAGQPRPPGARLVLHYGAVRVSAGAGPAEQSVLGPAATFTHKLEATAAGLGASFVLSEPAVQSLDLARLVTPLGSHPVGDMPDTHALYALQLR